VQQQTAKKVNASVGLDISAACKLTPWTHDALVSRLESQFGVVGSASNWLRSYLSGHRAPRRLLVTLDSVLGPLLFTAYVSPEAETVHIEIRLVEHASAIFSHCKNYTCAPRSVTLTTDECQTVTQLDILSRYCCTAPL